jgi:hypothetical protein
LPERGGRLLGSRLGRTGTALAVVSAYFLVGFLTCRAVSNELDKALLRSAVRSAAVAPAAHPDVAKALERVPPYAVYELANTLAPRYRLPPGLRLPPVALHRAHPQRL